MIATGGRPTTPDVKGGIEHAISSDDIFWLNQGRRYTNGCIVMEGYMFHMRVGKKTVDNLTYRYRQGVGISCVELFNTNAIINLKYVDLVTIQFGIWIKNRIQNQRKNNINYSFTQHRTKALIRHNEKLELLGKEVKVSELIKDMGLWTPDNDKYSEIDYIRDIINTEIFMNQWHK